MSQVLAIAVGGAIGALARYWMSGAVYGAMGRDFPWGTLSVNVLGSALIGLCFAYLTSRAAPNPAVQSLLMVGFLGAFTTFSTFSLETLSLLEAGHLLRALSNAVISVMLCVFVCWGGLVVGRQWFGAA